MDMVTKTEDRRRRRRREVGLALLLLLVAWELPLNTEAAAAAAATAPIAPPPDGSSEYLSGSDGSINVNFWDYLMPVNWLVNTLLHFISVFQGWEHRITYKAYSWFCSVWQTAMRMLRGRVDWVESFVLKYVDPGHNFRGVEEFLGFTHFMFDFATYPWKWVKSFMMFSSFGHCFKLTVPRCERGLGPGKRSTLFFCMLKFLADCTYYDYAFEFRKPIPWPLLTGLFRYYRTPPGGKLPDPFWRAPYRGGSSVLSAINTTTPIAH